jgi:hypothetical protein
MTVGAACLRDGAGIGSRNGPHRAKKTFSNRFVTQV